MPLRMFYGHLMLSMIAVTVNVHIQNKANCIYDEKEELFMTLKNQKCMIYKSRITNAEPQKRANELYKAFGINCPLYIEQAGDRLILRNHLAKDIPNDPWIHQWEDNYMREQEFLVIGYGRV